MLLNRLCLILPADLDEVEPPPPPPPKPIKPISHRCRRKLSSVVRRSLGHFCNHGWVKPCRCACYADDDRHHHRQDSSSLFEDIPGNDAAADKKASYDNPRVFCYAELYIGSNGFSDKEVLGSGGFGRVYRAVLPSDGTVVAVKCVVGGGSERFEKTFSAELAAVAQLRHRNLVRLRGWCIHDHQLLLVYDYMPNSSLDRLLFGSSAAAAPLGWKRRERIVTGLAAALFYIHEQLNTQIIHRDVKTSNVMLDSGYNARLGDFGLARWLEHDAVVASTTSLDSSMRSTSVNTNYQFRLTDTSKIGGTIGYLPPESFRKTSAAVTAKSDVFSFGVVVLEVATGRRAVDLSCPDDEIILLDWARRLADEGKCSKARDRRLPEGSYKLADMERLIHLGLLCSVHDPSSRPTMKWVTEILSGNQSSELPALPSFKSHPYLISLPPSTITTNSGISKLVRLSNYITANYSTIYLTAENGDSDSNSTNSSRQPPPPPPVAFPSVDTPREIPFKEIVAITNNFSEDNMVAELDFGTGYHGYLDNGRVPVLVKRLGMKTCPALRARFSDELKNIGRLRHRHLVQLRGWCTEQGEMLVVYDYPSCSLLTKRLFHHGAAKALSWQHRYGIIKSLASAVLYLHEEWDEQVIHRNITSSAIFLDADMNPRLGSFALAEFLTRNEHGHHHTAAAATPSVRGIFGYMAPEYMQSGEATTVADIYSFGVVVLEVVTGQMAVDFRWPEVLLVRKIRGFATKGRPLEDIADWRMEGDYDQRELKRVVQLGLACTSSDLEARPSMREIVSILDGNEELRKSMEGKREEGMREWEGWNDYSLSMIRRIQAIGIQ